MSDISGEPVPATAGTGLSEDEQSELERLRAEVASLRSRRRPRPAARIGWRAPVAVVLIVVGCLLAPVSVLAVWTANQVSSTSRYMANVEPLVHDPAVQNALTDKLTTEITSHLNVTARTNQAASLLTSHGLPRVGALLQTFGPSITSAVTGYIHSQVHKIVTSPQFATCLGSGQHRCPPANGEGPLRAGRRRDQRQQRAGRPQPRPVHQPRQAGPGHARVHASSTNSRRSIRR